MFDGGANGGGARWIVGIVAGSPMGFSESSRKTSYIISHSRSISVMSFCRLACKEMVVYGDRDTYMDECVGRSAGGCKGLNSLRTGSLS